MIICQNEEGEEVSVIEVLDQEHVPDFLDYDEDTHAAVKEYHQLENIFPAEMTLNEESVLYNDLIVITLIF